MSSNLIPAFYLFVFLDLRITLIRASNLFIKFIT
nr:MAG TPA: hypothetical protein [Crassvirales sp.]DAK71253.1 MAG TPA: hypothetical protein [Caudoviricetes sp.]DAP79234.1 MAG TPA: hypothetical protein [Caudoviricetes sp.]